MYLVGKGADVMGPGTSMVQRINWTPGNEAQAVKGFGCACGGKCGKGLGIFEGGMNVSTWGPVEWTAVGVGAYMVLSTIFTTQRAVRRVRALPSDARAATRRARRRVGRRIAGE